MSNRSSQGHTPDHSPPPLSRDAQSSENTSSSSSPKKCKRSSKKKLSSGSEESTSPYFQIKKPSSFFASTSTCKKAARSPSADDVFKPHSTESPNGHTYAKTHSTGDTAHLNGDTINSTGATAIVTNGTACINDTPPILTTRDVHECPPPSSTIPDPPTRVVLAPSIPPTLGFSPKTPPKKPPRARPRPQSAYSVSGEGSKEPAPPLFPNSQRYRPYSTKLVEQPLMEQTPPTESNLLVPLEVTSRLADLESSLESSFHNKLEPDSKADLSPSRRGQQIDKKKAAINRRSTSPSPIRTYRYMSSAGTRLSPASVRSEFEYSMEPRNFSRPTVRSPPCSIAPPSFTEKEEEENLLNGVGAPDGPSLLEVPQTDLAEKLSSSPMNKNWVRNIFYYNTLHNYSFIY